jgi:hypothetical protein
MSAVLIRLTKVLLLPNHGLHEKKVMNPSWGTMWKSIILERSFEEGHMSEHCSGVPESSHLLAKPVDSNPLIEGETWYVHMHRQSGEEIRQNQ